MPKTKFLSFDLISKIVEAYQKGENIIDISKYFNIHRGIVSKIIKYKVGRLQCTQDRLIKCIPSTDRRKTAKLIHEKFF